MPNTSHNIIKMGGVIQGELNRSVLKISGVINCFYLLENLHFSCIVLAAIYVYGVYLFWIGHEI